MQTFVKSTAGYCVITYLVRIAGGGGSPAQTWIDFVGASIVLPGIVFLCCSQSMGQEQGGVGAVAGEKGTY